MWRKKWFRFVKDSPCLISMVIDGKKIARKIIELLKSLPRPPKKLAAVLVGANPASISFLKQKERIAMELGIEFKLCQLPGSISENDVIQEIKKLNRDGKVGGIIIQLPLPEKFNRENVIDALDPAKDIDALRPESKVAPLAVEVVKDVLEEARYDIKDKVVGVVGRGLLVGRPIAEWLSGKPRIAEQGSLRGRCREVIIFHTKTDFSRLKDCDLVISGVGKAGLIKPEMLKPNAGIIDFGFDTIDGKIHGDFDSESLNATPHTLYPNFYTPTPGGTGPILVAEIFKNFHRLSN